MNLLLYYLYCEVALFHLCYMISICLNTDFIPEPCLKVFHVFYACQSGLWLLQVSLHVRGKKGPTSGLADISKLTHPKRVCNHDLMIVQISDWMTKIAKDNPDLVTIVEYGKTYEKRTISLLKVTFSDSQNRQTREG